MIKPDNLLKEKTALITGATGHIGRNIALSLAKNGINIIIHFNKSKKEALSLEREIIKTGGNAWIVKADLSNNHQTDKLFDTAIKYSGKIDFLINNASLYNKDTIDNFSIDDFNKNINTNALAPLLLGRRFAEQKIDGSIVNLLDTRIVRHSHSYFSYHLSKKVLQILTNIMAVEFAPKIKVNAVAPGIIFSQNDKKQSYADKIAKTNVLKNCGNIIEVVDAVLFLIKAQTVTGQVIYVDGGSHLRGNFYGNE